MTSNIRVYSVRWCPDCMRARRVLRKMGIAYEEIDIDRVPGAEEVMRSLNGGSGKVPTIFIGDNVLIEPSDKELRDALLDLTGVA